MDTNYNNMVRYMTDDLDTDSPDSKSDNGPEVEYHFDGFTVKNFSDFISNVDAYIITQAQLQASDDDDDDKDQQRDRNRYRNQDGENGRTPDQTKGPADTSSGKDEWAF